MVRTEELGKIITQSGKKKGYLAGRLGMSIQTFRKKCCNKADFTAAQIKILCDELSITDPETILEIFFAN